LAVKGFVSELSPTNFLPCKEKEDNAAAVYKSLTYRTSLLLGSALVLLLAVQIISSWLIQSRVSALQEQFVVLRPQLDALTALRRDVGTLEMSVAGSTGNRTATAKTIHDIARATPENVWLYRLKMSNEGSGDQEISLFGYSTTGDGITAFLKKLQSVCSDVWLVRSSVPLQTEGFIPAAIGAASFTTFEIRATEGN
jgi:Tfp pilus assembly protein PilN